MTFGRTAACDVSLTDDPEVSRVHARVFWRGAAWWLEDLGSTNGTFVGEFRSAERIAAPRKLEPGQFFRVGLTRFRLEAPAGATLVNRASAEALG